MKSHSLHLLLSLLALLLMLPAAGCAGNHETRPQDSPGHPPADEQGGSVSRVDPDELKPWQEWKTAPEMQQFVTEGYVATDPSLVSPSTGAGDPARFDGDVVVIVVDPHNRNASDDHPGTEDEPLKTLTAAVERMQRLAARDQLFHVKLHEATYRESVQITGAKGRNLRLLLEGIGEPVIKGSEVYTGWEAIGDGLFAHSWDRDWGLYTESEDWARRRKPMPERTAKWVEDAGDLFNRREMVIFDGRVLRQVLKRNELDQHDGSFYVDEAGDRIILSPPGGAPPDNALIEVAERPLVFVLQNAQHVTVRGIHFAHSTTPPLMGMVQFEQNDDLLIEDCRVEESNSRGLALNNNRTVTIRRVVANRNGKTGMQVGGSHNLLMEDCVTNENNWRGHWGNTYAWAIGGMKTVFTVNGVIRRHTARNNLTRGIWYDLDNINVTIDDCDLSENSHDGLFLEAGRGPLMVKNSRMVDNRGYGLLITNAERITVKDNLIAGNGKAQIHMRAYARVLHSRLLDRDEKMWSQHVKLVNNTIRSDNSEQLLWSTDMGRESLRKSLPTLQSDRNIWIHPNPDQAFLALGKRFGWDDWVRQAGEGERSEIRTR